VSELARHEPSLEEAERQNANEQEGWQRGYSMNPERRLVDKFDPDTESRNRHGHEHHNKEGWAIRRVSE